MSARKLRPEIDECCPLRLVDADTGSTASENPDTAVDFAKLENRAKLLDALSAAIRIISASDIAEYSAPVRVPHDPGAVYGHSGTEWPRLGGERFVPHPHALLESAQFRRLYLPGATVKIYATGSTGLRRLAAVLDLPLRKVGATENADVRIRISDLSRDNYGGRILSVDGPVDEPGFNDYFAAPIELRVALSPFSPVTPEPRAFSVRLPASMTFADFERQLQAETRPVSLYHWARTDAGRSHLSRLGVRPAIAARLTNYRYGGASRLEPAEEILVFRPRQEGDRLAWIIERIILRHLGLTD